MRQFRDGEYLVTETDSGAVIREIFSLSPEISYKRRISKLEFFDRFTDEEEEAIEAARLVSGIVRRAMKRFELASVEADGTSVDLDDPRTVEGVQGLEVAGIIGQGRAAQILGS